MARYTILLYGYESDFLRQITPNFEKVGGFRVTPKREKLEEVGIKDNFLRDFLSKWEAVISKLIFLSKIKSLNTYSYGQLL
ncbi:MAG: hypothetical protein H8E17_15725 [Deltaproteobacteria bacterium]|nr:hypothetical protein [Deltaproteobacteria bacterium]